MSEWLHFVCLMTQQATAPCGTRILKDKCIYIKLFEHCLFLALLLSTILLRINIRAIQDKNPASGHFQGLPGVQYSFVFSAGTRNIQQGCTRIDPLNKQLEGREGGACIGSKEC